MFQIDDQFLASIGYDIDKLSDEQKQKYINELTNELNARATERLVSELNEHQVDELNDIQENADRAYRWLDEFHSDYRQRDEFKQLVAVSPNERDAVVFYAASLWMQDAVPRYGELMQQEMNEYHRQLVAMRQAANDYANKQSLPEEK